METILDDFSNENKQPRKSRHIVVMIWLILMIIANCITSFAYFFHADTIAIGFPQLDSTSIFYIIGAFGILNIIATILVLNWKKIGFYCYCISVFVIGIINVYLEVGIASSYGLLGILILFVILQLKSKNGISAWKNLE
jgi:Na+/melibiose symporter-like transporter